MSHPKDIKLNLSWKQQKNLIIDIWLSKIQISKYKSLEIAGTQIPSIGSGKNSMGLVGMAGRPQLSKNS